uniref:IF rod domain-containing protein n=1 Tax=Denticeps clupeoides TaxID=299321 RepID=A0AAY4DQW5_9TELE
MEIPAIRQSQFRLGEENYMMLDLNRRLESYLNRVKLLEEENELLREEIHVLRRSKEPQAQKKAMEDALKEARDELELAWSEKDRVELEMGNLMEELKMLGLKRKKEASAQEQARRRLIESKNELEEEQRAQIWLKKKVAQLESELLFQVQVHQEDVTSMKCSLAHAKPVSVMPQRIQAQNIQNLGEEYSRNASQAWKEASEVYQKQMIQLEDALSQAKERLSLVTQEKTDSQLRLQRLAKELEAAQMKKEMLVINVAHQKDRENHEIIQLQTHVEALEAEKVDLGAQINELIKEKHGLLNMKMSLSLEVATYRCLSLISHCSTKSNKSNISLIQTTNTISFNIFGSEFLEHVM